MKRFALGWLAASLSLMAAADPPAAGLNIVQATLHQRQEDGPSIAENYQYLSGELLYLSFRIGGYKVQKDKDKVDLRWQVIAVDPEGLLLAPPSNGAFQDEVTFNDKNWLPKVQFTLPLPGQIPPGKYQLKLHVADEIGAAVADKVMEFQVGGRPFPKVEGLSVVGLGFYRDEAERAAMEKVLYHHGQMLWAKFQVAGYQLGEKNRFEVEYSLSVLSGEEDSTKRKVLFTQEQAAADGGAPFYPQRYLNGAVSLSISPGVAPGKYFLLVKVKDKVGLKETEAVAGFEVEK